MKTYWPSAYSVRKMEAYLTGVKYEKEVKAVIYKNVSHLTGMMPNRKREKHWICFISAKQRAK